MRKVLSYLLVINFLLVVAFISQDSKAGTLEHNPTPTATPNPKELLKKAAEACLKVKTAKYLYIRENLDQTKAMFPPLKAQLLQERAEVPTVWMEGKFRASGEIVKADKTDEFAYAYDGKIFRYLDITGNIVNVMKTPTGAGVGPLLRTAGLGIYTFPEFSDSEPLKTYLEEPAEWTYEGVSEVDGISCNVILQIVKRSLETARGVLETQTKTYIYLGEKDSLPRRYLLENTNGQVVTIIQATAKDLKINEPFGDDAFLLETPDGFAERLITEQEISSRGLLQIGMVAPDWKLKDAEGVEHKLSDYRGKIVIMDFWATWCGPCLKSMPEIQKLHERFKNRGVVVLGITTNDDSKLAANYVEQKGYTYDFLFEGELLKDYNATALPTLYVIGSNGKIIHAEIGIRAETMESLVTMIEGLLQNNEKD
jgi:peroxiredoxin